MLRPLSTLTACLCLSGAWPASAQSLQTSPRDRFWGYIEAARAGAITCSSISSRLHTILGTLPDSALVDFNTELSRRLAESYSWDLWAVAYIANGGASDDGFDYFRGWLISKGRQRFDHAIVDPPAAVEGTWPFGSRECEAILEVSSGLIKERTGAYPAHADVGYPTEPRGQSWQEDSLSAQRPDLVRRVNRWSWFAWF